MTRSNTRSEAPDNNNTRGALQHKQFASPVCYLLRVRPPISKIALHIISKEVFRRSTQQRAIRPLLILHPFDHCPPELPCEGRVLPEGLLTAAPSDVTDDVDVGGEGIQGCLLFEWVCVFVRYERNENVLLVSRKRALVLRQSLMEQTNERSEGGD